MTTGKSLIKQAFIAALCEHPDAEQYRARAFAGDNLEQLQKDLAEASRHVTKADILTPFDDGKFIMDTENAWKNFHKIEKLVRDNGEKFEVADFLKETGSNERTLLTSAEKNNGLEKLFSASMWKGRVEEMEHLWFFVSAPDRKAFNKGRGILPVKREIMMAEGKTPREDVLEKAGIDPTSMVSLLMNDGRMEDFQKKLSTTGNRLCKQDLFVVDNDGDTFMYSRQAWDKYDKVVDMLAKNGEKMEVQDFLFKRGWRQDILTRAAESHALDKVFNPDYWVGRPEEMVKLWSHVKPGWQVQLSRKDFSECLAEAEDKTWGPKLAATEGWANKPSLMKPLLDDAGRQTPVIPLGLKSTWQGIDGLCATLKTQGAQLTLGDLRMTSGYLQTPVVVAAAQADCFDKVLSITEASGEKLTIDDFLLKSKNGKPLIQILGEKKQLKLAFSEKIWVGRIKEMQRLWQHVPPAMRSDIDFADVQSRVRVASVQMLLNNKAKRKNGGPKL